MYYLHTEKKQNRNKKKLFRRKEKNKYGKIQKRKEKTKGRRNNRRKCRLKKLGRAHKGTRGGMRRLATSVLHGDQDPPKHYV